MARSFNDASSEYLETDAAPATAPPITLACWAWTDDLTVSQYLIYLADKDVANMAMGLLINGVTAGDPIQAAAYGTTLNSASTSSGPSASTWFHACAVFSAANARAAYIDGGSKGTNTEAKTISGIDRVSIGRAGDSTPAYYTSGYIAEAGVWTVALSDAEVALLAAGARPVDVQPANLVAYWPLVDDDVDKIAGTYNLTAYNTPSFTAHPPTVLQTLLRRKLVQFRIRRAQ